MFEEEAIQLPFIAKDQDGNPIFRDALTFESITDLRNTSKAEREAMMQQRYDGWQAAIEAAKNIPAEEQTPAEEG